jgi:hypothetical protein
MIAAWLDALIHTSTCTCPVLARWRAKSAASWVLPTPPMPDSTWVSTAVRPTRAAAARSRRARRSWNQPARGGIRPTCTNPLPPAAGGPGGADRAERNARMAATVLITVSTADTIPAIHPACSVPAHPGLGRTGSPGRHHSSTAVVANTTADPGSTIPNHLGERRRNTCLMTTIIDGHHHNTEGDQSTSPGPP